MLRPDTAGVRSEMRRSSPWLITSAVLFFAGAAVCLLGLGRWLVVEDPLEKAQAIVVLSGRMPVRALDAARLYRGGYAPEIWLTRAREPEASLATLDIAFQGEEFYNTRVLIHQGVPAAAIRVLSPPIDNTADELRDTAKEMARSNSSAVIIVTTKAHTRRVRALWRKLSGQPGRVIIRAAENDPFDAAHWWRSTGDALDVLREVLGLLNAWAGLPLQPAK